MANFNPSALEEDQWLKNRLGEEEEGDSHNAQKWVGIQFFNGDSSSGGSEASLESIQQQSPDVQVC